MARKLIFTSNFLKKGIKFYRNSEHTTGEWSEQYVGATSVFGKDRKMPYGQVYGEKNPIFTSHFIENEIEFRKNSKDTKGAMGLF